MIPILPLALAFSFPVFPVSSDYSLCKCKGHDPVLAEYIASTPIVFIGIARDVVPGQSATFQVLWSYKGIESRTIPVVLGPDNCGYPLDQDQIYVVYVHGSSSGYRVSKCSRTGPINERLEDVAFLSRRRSLLPPDSSAGTTLR